MFEINNGPCKGVTFQRSQVYYTAGQNSEDPKAGILLQHLTQAFLGIYDPREGWAVEVKSEVLPVDMFPLKRDGSMSAEAVPCVRFDASLKDPQGRVIATASTVWTMAGPTEWERGETNARLRLYEAAGLQSRFDIPEGVDLPVTNHSGGTAKVVRLSVARKPVEEPKPVAEDAGSTSTTDADAQAPEAGPDEKVVEEQDDAVTAADSRNTAASAEASEIVASNEPVAETEIEGKQAGKKKSGRAKRERLSDDADAPQALLDQCERLAKLRCEKMPELKTKGEANAFLKKLMG